jgi:acetolactate synthase-1/2/3 large subunit
VNDTSRSRPSPATVAATGRGRRPERINGAQAVVRSLEELGTDVVFGLPGGAVLPLYDAIYGSEKLNHILVRHEQGAGHAATGYAQVTGGVGVCIATSGPGATNLVTPLADANMDSVPVVAITGQVGTHLLGTDGFQEADIRGITMPVTKHSFMVTRAEDIPAAIAEAFHVATTGRPGAVLVDIPKDVQNAELDFVWPPSYRLPGYHPVTTPHSRQIEEAARMLSAAKHPVIYAGGGVVKSNAAAELLAFAEQTGIPVTTTLMALGVFPESHPQYLGMPGMHGTVPAVAALQKADLILAVGARFDDRVTGDVDSFAPDAAVIHADIDPAEIGKIREAQVPIVGDAGEVLSALNRAMVELHLPAPEITEWRTYLRKLGEDFPAGYDEPEDGKIAPQYVLEQLTEAVGPDGIYVAGVGQHQMWAAQFLHFEKPRTWLNSGGLGTMGYAVPAAMGAQAAAPDREVWAVDGDGCFQMTNQELVTCALAGLPIKIALINNGNLGMVRQWQTLFFNGHYSNTNLKPGENYLPDFVALAESMGCAGIRVTRKEDVADAIAKAREINDRPVVIDFIVGEDAQVWPMIAAGASNDEIQYVRSLAPLFEPDNVTEEGEQ